jgi:DNA invertase Pin-like site-specific DNA recombinase
MPSNADTPLGVSLKSGRSGLRMDGRDGLQSLMLEVESGRANFQAILVYDVSRWGQVNLGHPLEIANSLNQFGLAP